MAVKIHLDAGHYGKYNQSPAVKGYYESEMNWKLHLKLKRYLEDYGFIVTQTRIGQAKDMEVYQRGKSAKGCDLLLSIHSNAVGSRVDENVDQPVVFVPLDKSGDKLGKLLGDCIAKTMGTKNAPEVRSKKGNNGDYYGVIRGATAVGVPGLILEHSFHTNTRSTKWLMVDSNLDKLAKAEADAIASYFGIKKQTSDVIYRVQVGAYSVKANADKMLAKLKAAGFDGFITTSKK
jgi:N-acetylmuramoyl-L-alanine amidase